MYLGDLADRETIRWFQEDATEDRYVDWWMIPKAPKEG